MGVRMLRKSPRMINAGHFDKKIEIQEFKGDFDDDGMWVEDYFKFMKAMAYIFVNQLKQVTENDVQTVEGYTEMTIRQSKKSMEIEKGMRVLWKVYGKDYLYEVDDVDYRPEDNMYITLKCIKV